MTAIYIKSKEEIEGFGFVGKETARILKYLSKYCQAGWKPTEIDEIAREECKKINALPAFLGYKGFPSSLCFSKNNVMVHGIPDNIPLKRGDVVSIDFGLNIDGFIGDTAITFVVGPNIKSKKQARLISECNFALYRATKVAKDGNRLSEISKEIWNVAQTNKFQIPQNYGGHGLNRHQLHAPPFIPNIPTQDDFTLRSGMVIAIEPMFIDASSNNIKIANDNWAVIAEGLTAHFEHTIVVGESEGQILTQ